MENNFDTCLKLVLKHEGGYVDNPKDPGGATNLGVTQRVWEAWIGYEVTKEAIKNLTVADVTPLYRKRYWNVCRCDSLPAGLDYLIFDIAVNSGTGRAAKFLQSAVGATPDGVIGDGTLTCVKRSALSVKELIEIICNRRAAFYRSINGFDTFGNGWLRRNNEVQQKAIQMGTAV